MISSHSFAEMFGYSAQASERARKVPADDRSLIPTAVEEVLRFNPAVHYFGRTATRDTELRDETIRQGDKVTMEYA